MERGDNMGTPDRHDKAGTAADITEDSLNYSKTFNPLPSPTSVSPSISSTPERLSRDRSSALTSNEKEKQRLLKELEDSLPPLYSSSSPATSTTPSSSPSPSLRRQQRRKEKNVSNERTSKDRVSSDRNKLSASGPLLDSSIPSFQDFSSLPLALKEIEKLHRLKESLLDAYYETKQQNTLLVSTLEEEKENFLEFKTKSQKKIII
jgi:hypothetical protein